MQYRKDLLVNDHYYHIFSRSIAQYIVFNNTEEYSRMIEILKLYCYLDFCHKYSRFINFEEARKNAIIEDLEKNSPVFIEIIAYCIMPTHLHLVLKQITNHGISNYIAKVLNSYSRYFNLNHKRMGPLWAGRFKSVLVLNDEQLLHLTRYIHLNPTSAGVVKSLQDWQFSSYLEYIDSEEKKEKICSYNDLFDFSPKEYKKFVSERKSYQRKLSHIKNLLIDNYTG
ncbi:MAG: transposase [Patescibacteria group bacterium]|nr:transposase [Patescibacteria group bacterium]